ncbi:hypothetical protein VKT23_002499 [Stygiomarasmius scandens]|uniref:F-box domain-containing protein n=1 Tax=Marasmiellus scandens TaxID=2682957 RepID=A0ABR1K2E5_9AGAR
MSTTLSHLNEDILSCIYMHLDLPAVVALTDACPSTCTLLGRREAKRRFLNFATAYTMDADALANGLRLSNSVIAGFAASFMALPRERSPLVVPPATIDVVVPSGRLAPIMETLHSSAYATVPSIIVCALITAKEHYRVSGSRPAYYTGESQVRHGNCTVRLRRPSPYFASIPYLKGPSVMPWFSTTLCRVLTAR